MVNEIEELRELLKTVGLRCTTARLSVMRELRNTSGPASHADLADTLVPQGFDKATIYRNLMDLTDCGLVSRSELGDHVWRFELRDPNSDSDIEHPHFVCVDCGSVVCLKEIEFPAATRRKWSSAGSVTEVLLKGHCTDCETAS